MLQKDSDSAGIGGADMVHTPVFACKAFERLTKCPHRYERPHLDLNLPGRIGRLDAILGFRFDLSFFRIRASNGVGLAV